MPVRYCGYGRVWGCEGPGASPLIADLSVAGRKIFTIKIVVIQFQHLYSHLTLTLSAWPNHQRAFFLKIISLRLGLQKKLYGLYYVIYSKVWQVSSVVYQWIWFFAASAMSGGSVQCPWYFLLAHAASAPLKPWMYAAMNCAEWLAYLWKFCISQWEWNWKSINTYHAYHLICSNGTSSRHARIFPSIASRSDVHGVE